MNVCVSVKYWMLGALPKMVWNPSAHNSKCSKACKIGEYLHIKNCPCEKTSNR